MALMLAGCFLVKTAPLATGPPAGWTGTSDRWWRIGEDTTGIFRDLETLQAMTNTDVTYASNLVMAQDQVLAHQLLAHAVKQSLIRIIRNEPEVVDSLFETYVVPKILRAKINGDPRDLLKKYKRVGYKVIRRHFIEPRTIRRLGTDIQIPYPDSLRRRKVGGSVRMQVYIDDSGEPIAIEKLKAVHPVLDDIAMRATTEMRWQPAYLLDVGKSNPIPSWARFNVSFSTSDRIDVP